MTKRVTITMKATHLWTKEEEEQLTRRIVNNFHDLINRSEDEGLYWTGLKCDLIELATWFGRAVLYWMRRDTP